MKLEKFANRLVKKAASMVDDIEVNISTAKSIEFEIKNRKICSKIYLGRQSIGIRVLKNGKIGHAAMTSLDLDEGLLAVRKALTALRRTELKSFSRIRNTPRINNYDGRVMKLFRKPMMMKKAAEEMRDRFYATAKNAESFQGGISVEYHEEAIATLHGSAAHKRTAVEAAADVNNADFDYFISHKMPSSWEKIKNLGVEVYNSLPAEFASPSDLRVQGSEIDVVLDPVCIEAMLRAMLAEKVYGSSKMSRMSELFEGQKIADHKLTVIDTGKMSGLLTSSPTDDEGNVSRETIVIEKGVMKSFLYDAVSAIKAGKKPTGNGMRRPMLTETPAEAPVREMMRGIVVKPGKKKLAEMIKGIKKGIYIKSVLGLHTVDKARASFAVGVNTGKTIESGKFNRLLKPGTWNLCGHLLELDGERGMLSEIELSRETRNTSSAIMPWMKVKMRF